jgi:UDP-glucose 4-epimerase
MKILVTGGAGFIGGHIVEAYVNDGHEVVVIDDLSSGRREHVHPRARLYEMDVQSPEVEGVFEREKPEVLNHHAAQIDVRRSVADPVLDARVNLLGLLSLMEHGRRWGLKRVIFASSGGAVYGEQESFPAAESHRTEPVSPYGVSKLASERYLFFYWVTYAIPYIALRYANVYGPRQDPHGEAGVVAIFSEKLLRHEQPIINGDGRQTRDYVFVGDVVQANRKALSSDFCGALNIGTGVETDVNTLFDLLCHEAGAQAVRRHGPAKPGEQRRSVVDPSAAGLALGWWPTTSFSDGLRDTVDFFRRRIAHEGTAGGS